MVAVPATGGARLPGVHKSGKLGIRALAPEVDGLPLPQRLKPGSKRTAKCTAEAVLHPGESTLNLFYGLTSATRPQSVHVKLALQRLFLSPIMVAMAFVAPAFGSPLQRPALLMTSTASVDFGQVNVWGQFAARYPGVTRLASHHAVCLVIEFRVSKPAGRNEGFYRSW